jgi:hypothetical protein
MFFGDCPTRVYFGLRLPLFLKYVICAAEMFYEVYAPLLKLRIRHWHVDYSRGILGADLDPIARVECDLPRSFAIAHQFLEFDPTRFF